jgi:hypothetical protein
MCHLRMGTEWLPETLCFLSELTRLTAREDFITHSFNVMNLSIIASKLFHLVLQSRIDLIPFVFLVLYNFEGRFLLRVIF